MPGSEAALLMTDAAFFAPDVVRLAHAHLAFATVDHGAAVQMGEAMVHLDPGGVMPLPGGLGRGAGRGAGERGGEA